jgi:uncharacterized membrane protein
MGLFNFEPEQFLASLLESLGMDQSLAHWFPWLFGILVTIVAIFALILFISMLLRSLERVKIKQAKPRRDKGLSFEDRFDELFARSSSR